MQGVTILNEYVVNNAPWGFLPLVAGIAIAAVCLVYAISCYIDHEGGLGTMFMLLALISCVFIGAGTRILSVPAETHYQVIVDDSVSFAEFTNKYEILDKDGQIYVVVERNIDE